MAKSFYGSIALSKLKHVILEKKGKSGMVKGIFIPFEANGLVEGKEGAVYANISGKFHDEPDSYGNDAFVAHKFNSGKKWSDMTEDEKKAANDASPILGNLKWQDGAGGRSADSSGAVASAVISEDEDIPF